MSRKKVVMLGTRGIPASHGGFETFVGELAPYLSKAGWDVTVYCQEIGRLSFNTTYYDEIRLISISVPFDGVKSTILFDFLAMIHALLRPGLLLSFGYPTGIFAVFPRLLGRAHIINMDGIEWKRSQFGMIGKISLYLNERFAAYFANRLIADHPKIKEHLETRVKESKIIMIPYGAYPTAGASADKLKDYNIEENGYGIVIARPEPDNSILEIVRSFSQRTRKINLVVLGKLTQSNDYHRKIIESASEQVKFVGAIYEKEIVSSLRHFAQFYVHGHRVGGTNPSLVEALGAGNVIIAHDNEFNRWVASDAAFYFRDEKSLDELFTYLENNRTQIEQGKFNALKQYESRFTWENILKQYEKLLSEHQ